MGKRGKKRNDVLNGGEIMGEPNDLTERTEEVNEADVLEASDSENVIENNDSYEYTHNESYEESCDEGSPIDTVQETIVEPEAAPKPQPEVHVKEKYDAENKNQTGKYRLCVVKRASLLRWVTIKDKIKKINSIDFVVDGDSRTIYTREIATKSEAITIKKYLQGKGLKPVLENL